MKQRALETIKDIILIERNHWTFLPVVLTITCFWQSIAAKETYGLLLWVICSFFPVVFYLLRRKNLRFAAFLLSHTLFAALAFLLPGSALVKVIALGTVLFYTCHSFYLRLKEGSFLSPVHPAVTLGLCVCCTYLQHYLGVTRWDTIQLLGMTIGMILYFLQYYMEHYLEFLSFNESSAGYLPAAEIFRSGLGLMLAYTLVGTFLLLLSTNVAWLQVILQAIRRFLTAGLRFLFSFIPEAEPTVIIPQEEIPRKESGPGGLFPETGQSSLFWELLEVVVLLVLFCGLLYLGIRLLVKLVRFLRSRFSSVHFQEEHSFENARDQRERCEPAKEKRTGRQKAWAFLGPSQRIRRRYKKKLLSHADILSPGYEPGLGLLTARECAERLSCLDMSALYEKTRYTGEPVTEEMVRAMRRACREQPHPSVPGRGRQPDGQ